GAGGVECGNSLLCFCSRLLKLSLGGRPALRKFLHPFTLILGLLGSGLGFLQRGFGRFDPGLGFSTAAWIQNGGSRRLQLHQRIARCYRIALIQINTADSGRYRCRDGIEIFNLRFTLFLDRHLQRIGGNGGRLYRYGARQKAVYNNGNNEQAYYNEYDLFTSRFSHVILWFLERL